MIQGIHCLGCAKGNTGFTTMRLGTNLATVASSKAALHLPLASYSRCGTYIGLASHLY